MIADHTQTRSASVILSLRRQTASPLFFYQRFMQPSVLFLRATPRLALIQGVFANFCLNADRPSLKQLQQHRYHGRVQAIETGGKTPPQVTLYSGILRLPLSRRRLPLPRMPHRLSRRKSQTQSHLLASAIRRLTARRTNATNNERSQPHGSLPRGKKVPHGTWL